MTIFQAILASKPDVCGEQEPSGFSSYDASCGDQDFLYEVPCCEFPASFTSLDGARLGMFDRCAFGVSL